MDISKIALGELLGIDDEVIRRNFISILKQLQKIEIKKCQEKNKDNNVWNRK